MASTLDYLRLINERVKVKVPFVNYGGCAFYATLIQQRLAELGQVTESGVIAYTGPPDGADHVFTVVKLGRYEYFHDGTDTMTMAHWAKTDMGNFYRTVRVPSGETLQIVNSNRWNVWFNAKHEVPVLCSIIEDTLGAFVQRPHFDTIQGIKV